MGGIRSPRRGTLLSVPSVGASAGYLGDGDESYHGEVAEAEEVDVQRLYRLEAARRGYCLVCKAHTVGRGEMSCTKCGTNFDYTSGEEGLNSYGARDRPLLHAELPESSPPSRRSHHRRSPRLAPPPLPSPSDAAYPETRLATPKPQTQPRRSAPADQNNAVSEEGAPPIKAHPSQDTLHFAMMQISPTPRSRDRLVKSGLVTKSREIPQTDDMGSSPPSIVIAGSPEQDPPVPALGTVKPSSRFYQRMPSRKPGDSGEGPRGSGEWELDIVSLYEADSPSQPYERWI
ncbi:hypothetical protein QBC33DRAFT_528094 [Phialemonium atrogriseum]|uniref:Uncharacterized protein n=1 Tax=Phialemonium atrogriseum TaxID=1093897 RepID=A0AAJ0C6L7_9PEZI|nr:uncharacterized protein QBC33DRAFT_528094 [Phialemonium atrogriseum]KAK1770462.1 hypothetical protein QBC33DRAFT_528094 [Phialemonium atrogriseum]